MPGRLTPAWIIGYGALIGMTQGMKSAISDSAYAYDVGRRHIGSIKGLATTLSVGATAIGPLIFALGRDATGSYLPVLAGSAILPLLLAVAALRLRPRRASGSV